LFMKVIIDTNILISAILKNRIPEEVVFSIIINHAFQWLASLEILDEYKSVLMRPKFKLPEMIIQNWFSRVGWATSFRCPPYETIRYYIQASPIQSLSINDAINPG